MERKTFNGEMARLSIAFDEVLSPKRMDGYWDRMKNHRDDLFVLAVNRLIDESERFPNIAAIHREYYAVRDAQREVEMSRAMPQDAALEAGKRNAVRLAKEGLPSDVMLAKGFGVVHPPGSKQHEAILGTYDRMARTLMYQIDERSAQADATPNNPDLRRRVAVLVRTLSETEKRRAHFEATGETLALVNLAPDAVGATPGALYLCPVCKATEDAPGRFLRVDATPGSRHYGHAIPCPRCRAEAYAEYVAEHGQPDAVRELVLA